MCCVIAAEATNHSHSLPSSSSHGDRKQQGNRQRGRQPARLVILGSPEKGITATRKSCTSIVSSPIKVVFVQLESKRGGEKKKTSSSFVWLPSNNNNNHICRRSSNKRLLYRFLNMRPTSIQNRRLEDVACTRPARPSEYPVSAVAGRPGRWWPNRPRPFVRDT